MRYFLDTNIFVFYALGGESLDKDVKYIFNDYENIIYISSEVIKETMHLIRHKKIDVKQWKNPNDVWKSIKEWRVKMPIISSDGQFRHYKRQGLDLVFNNTHEKNKIAR